MSYPELIIDRAKLYHNAKYLLQKAAECGISLHFVTKAFCAQRPMVRILEEAGAHDFADSHIENLREIADFGRSHMLVRIPMPSEAHYIVRYADISFNSELKTLAALSDAALAQDRVHGVVLMLEMGDLREGFMPDDILAVVRYALNLRGISIVGVGANFNCYGGVIPEEHQLKQLVEVADLIRNRFDLPLPIVSGGNSGSLYLLMSAMMPPGITHLRIGEAFLLGEETSYGKRVGDCYTDVFTLRAEVVEARNKDSIPVGKIGRNALGEVREFTDKGFIKRAIIALGEQDISVSTLVPKERNIVCLGASSDLSVFDVTDALRDLGVGDMVDFSLDYRALSRAFISPYISKRLV